MTGHVTPVIFGPIAGEVEGGDRVGMEEGVEDEAFGDFSAFAVVVGDVVDGLECGGD